jgi:hypothetical protein
MGHELYRMIRDGAPASWSAAMRLVALIIADDALDPSQGTPPDGGWPISKIRLDGRRADDGQWYDGLTERTGLSGRVISRVLTDLGRAGYEMREQIGTDKHGRPRFAYPWRARRFRVPLLPPRRSPDPATYSTPDPATYSTPDPATYSTPDPATIAGQGLQVARSGVISDQIRQPARSPDPATSFPIPLPNPIKARRRTTRKGSSGPPAATDDDSETRPNPGHSYGSCKVCGNRYRLDGDGLLQTHGPRRDRCAGSRSNPADRPQAERDDPEPGEPEPDDAEFPF